MYEPLTTAPLCLDEKVMWQNYKDSIRHIFCIAFEFCMTHLKNLVTCSFLCSNGLYSDLYWMVLVDNQIVMQRKSKKGM